MPYNRVIAIGDSFTRGDELADCAGIDLWKDNYSNVTWSALLAKKLEVGYHARAIGGIGNQWISWKVSAGCKQNTLYIISWTYFERFDYVDIETDKWKTTHPRHEDKLNHCFYRNLDSDIWNLYRNLQQMHSTISLLKQNNVNFIMTCLDPQYSTNIDDIRPPESIIDPESIVSTWSMAISNLQKQVLPYIVDFEGMSFLEWSKHKGFELGPKGHPLEQAHSEAASYILDKCNKYLYNKGEPK